jgi:hypothetical protein
MRNTMLRDRKTFRLLPVSRNSRCAAGRGEHWRGAQVPAVHERSPRRARSQCGQRAADAARRAFGARNVKARLCCRWFHTVGFCAPDLEVIANHRSGVVSLDKMEKVVF